MHIAGASPPYISRESVPRDVVSNEKEITDAHALRKPQHAIGKITKGKLDKWYQHNCLFIVVVNNGRRGLFGGLARNRGNWRCR
jgi:translation elongation factor EF-Ts